MFTWATKLVRHLPGLSIAQPETVIAFGITVVVAALLVLVMLRRYPVATLVIAIGSTSIWTALCIIVVLANLYNASFNSINGKMGPIDENLFERTLPIYYALSCFLIWGTYLLTRLLRSRQSDKRSDPHPHGFPIVPTQSMESEREQQGVRPHH